MLGFRHFNGRFSQGNRITLLENGEQFFPQLLKRIKHARHEILLETFILENDRVGQALKKALIGAANRGVWISLTADSWGSYYLDQQFIDELSDAGVVFQIYDPQPRWYNGRPKLFRRLHRKLAVIDGLYAFIGGINMSHDHMLSFGPEAKQDYAAELTGPVVQPIRELCKSYVRDARDEHLGELLNGLGKSAAGGQTELAFVSRDNRRHRNDIEKAYLAAMRQAKKRIWIANAYFFPGYRFMRAVRQARKRGVEVRLVLQGDPDIPFALTLARTLYDILLRNGVKLYEYNARPLHAKIAAIDDEWSTIGSSNLDPLSLAFNLEANVVVRDKDFNTQIADEVEKLQADSVEIEPSWVKHRRWYLLVKDFFTYHAVRHFPTVAGLFPAHTHKIREIKREEIPTVKGRSRDRQLARKYPESRNARRVIQQRDYDNPAEVS